MVRRARRVGLFGVAVALIALMFGDARLRATGETRADGRIAFAAGESGADYPSQLAVMDADGKHVRALPPFDVAGLSLSPDSRFIAFTQYQPSGCSCALGDLMTVTVDGRLRYRRVLHHDSLGGDLAWSPDGRSIAFYLHGGGIWAVNLSNHRERQIIRNGHSPTWSPDEKKLAFVRGKSIWVVDISTKKAHRLIRNGGDAEWSPDGKQIAFERCRDLGYDLKCFIYVMRSDGTKLRRLFEGEQPTWSPSGREIAFIGAAERREPYADAVIRARLDGTGRRVVFGQTPYCGCGAPEWGPRRRGGARRL